MNMTRTILLAACAATFCACASDRMDRVSEVSTDSLRNAVAVEIRQTSSQDDARLRADKERSDSENAANARHRCDAAESLPESIERIMAQPKDYVSNDSCAAILADAIIARFIRTDEKRYLEVLDALSRAADSKATELLGAAVLDLFRARPVELIRHLYSLQGDPAATEVSSLLITVIQLGRNSEFDTEIHGIL